MTFALNSLVIQVVIAEYAYALERQRFKNRQRCYGFSKRSICYP